MTAERRIVTIAIALIIASVLQMVAANAMRIGPARPDFILATLAASSIALSFPGGGVAGIWSGILMASVAGTNYGSFLVSRALAGTFCGWASQWLPAQAWPIGVPILALGSTLGAEAIYYIMAPTHRGLWWLEHMTLESLYDIVLSLPIAGLMILTGLRRPKRSAFE